MYTKNTGRSDVHNVVNGAGFSISACAPDELNCVLWANCFIMVTLLEGKRYLVTDREV